MDPNHGHRPIPGPYLFWYSLHLAVKLSHPNITKRKINYRQNLTGCNISCHEYNLSKLLLVWDTLNECNIRFKFARTLTFVLPWTASPVTLTHFLLSINRESHRWVTHVQVEVSVTKKSVHFQLALFAPHYISISQCWRESFSIAYYEVSIVCYHLLSLQV